MPTGPNRFAILSEDYVPSADVKTEKKDEKKAKTKTKKKSVVVLADKL